MFIYLLQFYLSSKGTMYLVQAVNEEAATARAAARAAAVQAENASRDAHDKDLALAEKVAACEEAVEVRPALGIPLTFEVTILTELARTSLCYRDTLSMPCGLREM